MISIGVPMFPAAPSPFNGECRKAPAPNYQVPPLAAGKPPTITVRRGAAHPSRLLLPVVPDNQRRAR